MNKQMMSAILQSPMKTSKKAQGSAEAPTGVTHVSHARTYHGSIPTLRPKCGNKSGCTRGKSIGKDGNADAIHPAKLIDQRSQKAGDDADHHQIDAEPQPEHVQVPAPPTLMFFLGQHAFYSAGFEAGEALYFGVPFGEVAFEDGSRRDVMLM